VKKATPFLLFLASMGDLPIGKKGVWNGGKWYKAKVRVILAARASSMQHTVRREGN
jgi:predicted RNase H-like nuclease